MVRVLFVCTGNICRSPTAEGVFRHLVEKAGLGHAIETRSAGTHAYHVGDGADRRSTIAAKRRGYDLSSHRAKRVEPSDFVTYDYVLAMDRDNLEHLRQVAGSLPEGMAKARPQMLLGFAPAVKFDEVPDPYARSLDGFELVLDMLESACEALLGHIRANDL